MEYLLELAIRRQAKLSREDLIVFVKDLDGFDLQDISRGLELLGKRPRCAGETAFPDSGTLIQAVRSVQTARGHGKIPPCERCDSSRLLIVEDPKTGDRLAYDCTCLKTWRVERARR